MGLDFGLTEVHAPTRWSPRCELRRRPQDRPAYGKRIDARWGRDPLRNDQPIQESIEFHPAAEGIESFVSPRRPRDAAVEELRRALRVNGIKR